MRIYYPQHATAWQNHTGTIESGMIPLEWRQEWFTNICLAIVLAIILFLMLLSIYLVFSKPAPTVIPGPDQTGTAEGGSAFADFDNASQITPSGKLIEYSNYKWEGC
jgi:hypothetical protein